MQVRQHVGHKRTFFYLEQLILKYDVDQQCINVKEMHEARHPLFWLLDAKMPHVPHWQSFGGAFFYRRFGGEPFLRVSHFTYHLPDYGVQGFGIRVRVYLFQDVI